MKPVTTPSRVPCNGCTLCCQGFQAVFIKPNKGDVAENYKTKPYANSRTGITALMLDHKPNGDCIYLDEGGCTIYDTRPHHCRLYDCRKVLLTLPHKHREKLISAGQLSRKVENAARKRCSTLTDSEVNECNAVRKELLNGYAGHVVIGGGKPTG